MMFFYEIDWHSDDEQRNFGKDVPVSGILSAEDYVCAMDCLSGYYGEDNINAVNRLAPIGDPCGNQDDNFIVEVPRNLLANR